MSKKLLNQKNQSQRRGSLQSEVQRQRLRCLPGLALLVATLLGLIFLWSFESKTVLTDGDQNLRSTQSGGSCGATAAAAVPAAAATAAAGLVPVTERSTEAMMRVRPGLEQQLAAKGLSWGDKVFIRIFKREKQLELWVQPSPGVAYQLFKTWPVLNWGSGTLGPKLKEGDGQAPEGFYYVSAGRLNPRSRFHLSFNLGFPNSYDSFHGRTGSALMVHGSNVSVGCYAVGDKAIEEIYSLIAAALRYGQPFVRVHIFPFHLTEENLKRESKSGRSGQNSDRLSFWENLREGYDWFQQHGFVPPEVTVSPAGRYQFAAGE